MNQRKDKFIPALRFNWLTDFYDPIVALTCREKKFKSLLAEQAAIKTNYQVLDIGSGTGHHVKLLNKAGYNAEGVDKSADMVTRAKNKYKNYRSYHHYQSISSCWYNKSSNIFTKYLCPNKKC